MHERLSQRTYRLRVRAKHWWRWCK